MSDPKLRREIALRAAQLMYSRHEREYFSAKRKAARMVAGDDRGSLLPSNAEIREQIQILADLLEGPTRLRELRSMRLEALRFMRLLQRWRPRLIGSVLTGHTRRGSDIDLHIFCDSVEIIADELRQAGYECEVQRKAITKAGEQRVYRHIQVKGEFPVELTVDETKYVSFPFKSSITGKLIEKAEMGEVEALLRREEPEIDLELELSNVEDQIDPWELYELLLRPLEKVMQHPRHHPEGDALFHSLQVFELALRHRAYDQEFLLAALLHDVGKGIDPGDHVGAGLEALEGAISERTAWFIEHHMEAHQCRDGTIGARARRRLAVSEDFEDLILLSEIDQAGRVPGAVVMTLDEALKIAKEAGEEV